MEYGSVREDKLGMVMADCDHLLKLKERGREGERERGERERDRERERERERDEAQSQARPFHQAAVHSTLSVTLFGFPCMSSETMVCSRRWALSTDTTPIESG